MAIDYIKRAEDAWARQDTEFHRAGRHIEKVAETQAGIIKYMEGMAQALAEAALASNKAVGDSPRIAIDKWISVVRRRAYELIDEKQGTGQKRIEKGAVIDQEKPDAVE